MKNMALVLAAVVCFTAQGTPARAHDRCPITLRNCCEPPTRWAPRHDSRDARLAITSETGDAVLLLTDDVVAVQLSDRALHKLDRKLKRERDEDDDNVLAQTIKTVVLNTVRSVLDHSAECSIRDLSDVEYRHGRLIFTTEDGERAFDDIDIGDRDMMEQFSESDAQAFVREFHRCKNRSR